MANNEIKLAAEARTEFGKGAARRLRRAGQTPAVVYGHGIEPMHLALNAHETFLALRTANALLEIAVEGEAKPILALPKQITRAPILPAIEHLDLILVKAGEKVTVDVQLILVGEAESGTLVNQDLVALSVLAPATDIPTEFEVSVQGLEVGAQILVSDIVLPEGVETAIEGDTLVLSVVPAPVAVLETEGEGDAAEAEAEAAE